MNNNENNQEPVINFGNSINGNVNTQPQSTIQPNNQNITMQSLNNGQSMNIPPMNTPPMNTPPMNNETNFQVDEQKTKKNRKIIIIIVVIIVVIVLYWIFSFVLSMFSTTNMLDNTRKSAFMRDAQSYLSYAKNLVREDETNALFGKTTKYIPECINNNSKKINIELIPSSNSKSPFGGEYLSSSYVEVLAIKNNNNSCDYEYFIYLTDGEHSIGSSSSPIKENNLSVNDVK